MAEAIPTEKKRGPSDATDYSSTKAPETQKHAEQHYAFTDYRLIPGGRQRSPHDPGMSGLDRNVTLADSAQPEDYGRPSAA